MPAKDERENLREKAGALEAIFKAFPDLLFRLEPDGTIVDYKAGDESDLYLPPNIFLGRKVQEILPPPVAGQVERAIRQVGQTKKMVIIEYSLPLKEGEQFYEARILPMEEGQIVTIVRNSTERKKMEDELRRGEERFRMLLETSPDMVFQMDREERYLYMNAPAAALLGGEPRDFIGKKQSEIFPPGEAEAYSKAVQDVFKTGKTYLSERTHHYLQGEIWTESRMLPICNARGEVISVLGFTRDMTRHKELEDKLQKQIDELRTIIDRLTRCEGTMKDREQEVNALLRELGRNPKY